MTPWHKNAVGALHSWARRAQRIRDLKRLVDKLERGLICAECGLRFWPTSLHPRKYCSYRCAHRRTSRQSMRRKRAAKKT